MISAFYKPGWGGCGLLDLTGSALPFTAHRFESMVRVVVDLTLGPV